DSMLGPDTIVLTVQNGLPWWYFQRLGGQYDNHKLESLDPSVSRILKSLLLTRKIRYSIPSASSSDETTLASIFHSLESTPDENGQLPRSMYPPSTFLARPAGNMKDDAIRASTFLFQTRSCARLSNMPSIQWWLARLAKFQAADASARPIASAQSTSAT